MKALLVIGIVVNLIGGIWILFQAPISKFPPETALQRLRQDYLKNDLTVEESNSMEYLDHVIRSQLRRNASFLVNAGTGAILLSAFWLFQNLALFSLLKKSSQAENITPLKAGESNLSTEGEETKPSAS